MTQFQKLFTIIIENTSFIAARCVSKKGIDKSKFEITCPIFIIR